jgi:cytochrome c
MLPMVVAGMASAGEFDAELRDRIASADLGQGRDVARVCVACHTLEVNGANKVGPTLWNIVNAPPARTSSYVYSEAMRAVPGTWGYEELDRFLKRPREAVPGTRMIYTGLPDPKDRAAVIAFLRTLSDAPAPLR